MILRGNHEIRCVKRKRLLETLAKELPSGTIRYSSKVVCIEESGFFKLVHLSDGTILKTKVKLVLIGIVKLSLSYIHSSNAINKILFTKVELTNYYWFFYKSTSDIILMFTKDNFTLQQLCKILLKKIVIVNLLYIVLEDRKSVV